MTTPRDTVRGRLGFESIAPEQESTIVEAMLAFAALTALTAEVERLRKELTRIASDHTGDGKTGYGSIGANHILRADCDACHRQQIAIRALAGEGA